MSEAIKIFQKTVAKSKTKRGEQIPLFKVFMPESIKKPLIDTVMSGYVGQGPKVDEFEEKFGQWVGHKHIVTVNTGTSALHLANHMCLKEPGDEIISTPMTCAATNTPIVNTKNGKIVWADIDPHTGSIDPNSIQEKITKKTRAILMVHWGGNPCDIDAINALGKNHSIPVIQDAAHGLGTTYKGKYLATTGSDFVMHSLQAIKHITTIDGGILICDNISDYHRALLLRWYGIDRNTKRKDFRCEENIIEAGYKYHMNDITAVIGIEQLKYVDLVVKKHRDNAAFYDQTIKMDKVKENPDGRSSYWLYTLLLPPNTQDEFIAFMAKKGIQVSRVHTRTDTHTAFKEFKADLPGVTEFSSRHMCIPVGWWVTQKEREKIAKAVNQFSQNT